MAIFVAFAWMIEAAEYLGLIEIEAQDPQSRAYRLAHQGLALLKSELVGVPIELLDERSVRKVHNETSTLFSSIDGVIHKSCELTSEVLLDLGPGGGLLFGHSDYGIEVKVQARTDDGGSHDVYLSLPWLSPTSRGSPSATKD